jgi:streptogramin lyase
MEVMPRSWSRRKRISRGNSRVSNWRPADSKQNLREKERPRTKDVSRHKAMPVNPSRLSWLIYALPSSKQKCQKKKPPKSSPLTKSNGEN